MVHWREYEKIALPIWIKDIDDNILTVSDKAYKGRTFVSVSCDKNKTWFKRYCLLLGGGALQIVSQ